MFKPNEDRVTVRPIPNPEKTKSGFFIPSEVKVPMKSAVVVDVGPGKECQHCGLPKKVHVEKGWLVMYPEQAGHEFFLDEVEYRTIRASDIVNYDPDYREQ